MKYGSDHERLSPGCQRWEFSQREVVEMLAAKAGLKVNADEMQISQGVTGEDGRYTIVMYRFFGGDSGRGPLDV